MKKEIIVQLHTNFENYTHVEHGVEYWFARDLQTLLGYNEWRNFNQVISKAKQACGILAMQRLTILLMSTKWLP